MLKKILKRPFYYFFTTLFMIVVTVIFCYVIEKRISGDGIYRKNWIDRQFIAIGDSFLVRPNHVVADIFDIIKFNLFTRGIDVRNLKTDYARLKQEYILIKDENKKLSDIIKYQPAYGKIIATGRVLSDPNNFGVGIFTISVGLKNNVRFGDIVTTQEGLVGKIVKIFSDTSIVLPVRHLSAKTIGRIKGKDNLVFISGRHLRGGVIDYISNTAGLEDNQQIITISDGVSIPAGVPIGTIMNAYDRPIRVKLAVDFSKLDYVTVVRHEKQNINQTDFSVDNIYSLDEKISTQVPKNPTEIPMTINPQTE